MLQCFGSKVLDPTMDDLEMTMLKVHDFLVCIESDMLF